MFFPAENFRGKELNKMGKTMTLLQIIPLCKDMKAKEGGMGYFKSILQ